MRPIKLRAWDTVKKKMTYIDVNNTFVTDSKNWAIHKSNEFRWTESILITQYNSDDTKNILMQFIWLLDKNGKEIYEGDILWYNWKKVIRVIKWSDEYFEWIWEYYLPAGILFESLWCIPINLYEIIWNIYENENLLTK